MTVAGRSGALPGTGGASVKVTPFAEYPPKGRATGGVRCQRFLKGEDGLIQAWIGPPPVLAATESGVMVDLSGMQGRRDGSGTALTRQLAYLGHPFDSGDRIQDLTPAWGLVHGRISRDAPSEGRETVIPRGTPPYPRAPAPPPS